MLSKRRERGGGGNRDQFSDEGALQELDESIAHALLRARRQPLDDLTATAVPVLTDFFAPLPRPLVSFLPDAFFAILNLQCAGFGTLNSRSHERIPTRDQQWFVRERTGAAPFTRRGPRQLRADEDRRPDVRHRIELLGEGDWAGGCSRGSPDGPG